MKVVLDTFTATDIAFLLLVGGVTFVLLGIVFITILLAIRRP